MTQLLLEGYTADEVLALSNAELRAIVLCDEPLVFRVGTASILGKFKLTDDTLFVELGHIDGGGEGALPTLASLADRYAKREGLAFIEWRVHAVHCAKPTSSFGECSKGEASSSGELRVSASVTGSGSP